MKDLSWIMWQIFVIILTISSIAVEPIKAAKMRWFRNRTDDPTSNPIPKHVQLFNEATFAYVRIRNTTVDSNTTDATDPETYFTIDMYGPTLVAIKSYYTGKYICHNIVTSYVEIKSSRDAGCLFKSKRNGQHLTYTSYYNKKWQLAFHGKGKKAGKPKKASRTRFSSRSSKYMEMPILSLGKGR